MSEKDSKYRCNICNKKYSSNNSLLKHNKKVHDKPSENSLKNTDKISNKQMSNTDNNLENDDKNINIDDNEIIKLVNSYNNLLHSYNDLKKSYIDLQNFNESLCDFTLVLLFHEDKNKDKDLSKGKYKKYVEFKKKLIKLMSNTSNIDMSKLKANKEEEIKENESES